MDQPQPPIAAPQPLNKKKRNITSILPVLLLTLLFIILVLWMNYPLTRHLMKLDPPTLTPSATATFIPTRTPRPTFTPTVTPLPSPTPMPGSSYVIPQPETLNPPIVGLMNGSIAIKAESAAIEPPLTSPQWVPSSRLIPGKDLAFTYYSTQSSGSATWKMDVSLASGLYRIYVMDTLYGSAGSLDFIVREGNTPLMPLTDLTSVNFVSSQADNDPQMDDIWHSIGIFKLTGADLLSISTNWGIRDEHSLVAIDRVVIEPLPAVDEDLLNRLPSDRIRYIVDDLDAKIDGNPLLISRDDTPAWNSKLQSVTNPDKDVKFTWTMPYTVSPGAYEILFWLPASHKSGGFEATIFANGQDLSSGKLPAVSQSAFPGGNWISMGVWDTSSPIFGNSVKYSVVMTIKGGTVGETGLDAIAFLGPVPGQATPTNTP